MEPLVEAIRRHVFAAEKVHGDDTPVPVLAPGNGRAKTGRAWVYVRDDRPFQGTAPPATAFFYSPDRKAERPREHLKTSPASCRPMPMQASKNSTIRSEQTRARSRRWPAGRIAGRKIFDA
ncbi:MAG: hypothetical protein EOR71_23375 [Mesorhizobium sp.]|nr:MAG: hypothetical protein EOR71_23375 [Mesorhizobium sp.]